MKHVEVVCAIIENDKDEVFICKRGAGRQLEGKWEFPGGKVEANESHEQTIIREIKEELEDRYSSIPEAVYNLMDIAYIKSLAKELLIEEIKEFKSEVRFKFPKEYKKVNYIYHILLKNYKENVVLYFGETPFFALKVNTIKREEILEFYKNLLKDLIENSRKK